MYVLVRLEYLATSEITGFYVKSIRKLLRTFQTLKLLYDFFF